IPLDEPGQHSQAQKTATQAVQKIGNEPPPLPSHHPAANSQTSRPGSPDAKKAPNDKRPTPAAQSSGGSAPSMAVPAAGSPDDPEANRQQQLQAALAELEQLTGLRPIKHEIAQLVNFLRVQEQRQQLG